MSFHVALYAEGGKDTGGDRRHWLAEGDVLPEDLLGPAHHLIRRALAYTRPRLPEEAIQFHVPNALKGGKTAKGSMLWDLPSVRRLLVGPYGNYKPHLRMLLVDQDGDPERHRRLAAGTQDIPHGVVAVAVRELEAWFCADLQAVRAATSATFSFDEAPEEVEPGEAKRRLEAAIAAATTSQLEERGRRIQIAKTCEIERLQKRCPSFDELLKALRFLPAE